MTSGWGFGEWGFSPWGGASPTSFACVPAGPQITTLVRSPGPGEENVVPDRIVKIAFYDTTLQLDINTVYVTINGVAALSGNNFLNGFNGSAVLFNDILTVQILNPTGWNYDSTFVTFAKIKNLAGESFESTWNWYTVTDPVCYTGLFPVPIEIALQQPLQRLLPAEFLRALLFSTVLKVSNTAIKNAPMKAARVIYQTACSTELSTLLNQYLDRNPPALNTIVCERTQIIAIDRVLMQYTDIIKQTIDALEHKGFITHEYMNTLHDYLNSANYNLRVSLVCNLVIISKLFEMNNLA